MQYFLKCGKLSTAFAFALIALPSLTPAQSAHDSSTSQAAERGHYIQTNLMADPTESVGKAPVHDPNLLNPWGLTRSPNGSPWRIGNNNSGTSTLQTAAAAPVNNFPAEPHPHSNRNDINSPFNNFVMVPPPAFAPCTHPPPPCVLFNRHVTQLLLNHDTPP